MFFYYLMRCIFLLLASNPECKSFIEKSIAMLQKRSNEMANRYRQGRRRFDDNDDKSQGDLISISIYNLIILLVIKMQGKYWRTLRFTYLKETLSKIAI